MSPPKVWNIGHSFCQIFRKKLTGQFLFKKKKNHIILIFRPMTSPLIATANFRADFEVKTSLGATRHYSRAVN
jgi:hypothetical protein